MKARYLTILIAALVLTLGRAAAAQMKEEVELRPGGRTIAGPGVATLTGRPQKVIWRSTKGNTFGNLGADICVTIHNFSPFFIDVVLVPEAPFSDIQLNIEPDFTFSQCLANANGIIVLCQSTVVDDPQRTLQRGKEPLCKYVWRVDQYTPNRLLDEGL